MAQSSKRRKIVCNTCNRSFDSDYRKRHDLKYHNGKLQRIHDLGAHLNPFLAAATAKKLHSKSDILPSSQNKTKDIKFVL